LGQAAESRSKAERSETEDKATYDMADNGVRLNRSERDAWEKILQSIEYGKKK
jgi:DNA primase